MEKTFKWHDAQQVLPDDLQEVLIYDSSHVMEFATYNASEQAWFYATGTPIVCSEVKWWTQIPLPTLEAS